MREHRIQNLVARVRAVPWLMQMRGGGRVRTTALAGRNPPECRDGSGRRPKQAIAPLGGKGGTSGHPQPHPCTLSMAWTCHVPLPLADSGVVHQSPRPTSLTVKRILVP